MVKRKIYAGTRDEGWSNGRYWKEKRAADRVTEEFYHAYCPDCDTDTLHEWDLCSVCDFDERRSASSSKIIRDPDPNAFVQDLTEL